jgi:hypothetical protein
VVVVVGAVAVEEEHVVPLQVEEPAARRHGLIASGDCLPASSSMAGITGM